jgi:hypothetical protein
MVGTPDEAIAKIPAQHDVSRHDRTLMQMSVGHQPQAAILRSIELLGTVVAPKVRGAPKAEGFRLNTGNNSIELAFGRGL